MIALDVERAAVMRMVFSASLPSELSPSILRVTMLRICELLAETDEFKELADKIRRLSWSSRSLTGTDRLFPPSFRAWVHAPSSGDVPPEARPYLEIAQQGAWEAAYDLTSPGSVIVVLRQRGDGRGG